MRIEVHLQREIARMHFHDPRQSNRSIARALNLSPNTVQVLRTKLLKTEVPWTQLRDSDDVAWRKALGTQDRSVAQCKPTPDWDWVREQMSRPDATLEVIWRDWRALEPEGIGYTRFTELYDQWLRRRHIVMRQHHVPGDRLFVDFAGRTMEIHDPAGGPSTRAQIFVATLGYSNFTHVQAVDSQTTPDWISCHIECFEAMGGVPKWVVSDNLKAAVWRHQRDHIELNPVYRACLAHYGTVALPARPRKPRDKGKAEVGVQIAQRWVLFRLRDRTFFSLAELNTELHKLTGLLNDHPFKKLPGTRRERFETVEREALQPLPSERYELSESRYGVRVGDDYHVEHGGNYYTVPYERRGERVDLRVSARFLEVFFQGKRIAVHAVPEGTGHTITVPEHRPIAHQRVLEGEPRSLAEWAARVGPKTTAMLQHHLQERSDATNGLKAARRIRDLGRLHGDLRIEEVCAYALPLNITALRSLESILKQGADKRPRLTAARPPSGTHENLRGAGYYGESQ